MYLLCTRLSSGQFTYPPLLVFITTLLDWYSYYPYYMDEETEHNK